MHSSHTDLFSAGKNRSCVLRKGKTQLLFAAFISQLIKESSSVGEEKSDWIWGACLDWIPHSKLNVICWNVVFFWGLCSHRWGRLLGAFFIWVNPSFKLASSHSAHRHNCLQPLDNRRENRQPSQCLAGRIAAPWGSQASGPLAPEGQGWRGAFLNAYQDSAQHLVCCELITKWICFSTD